MRGSHGAQDHADVWSRDTLCLSGGICHHTAPPPARAFLGRQSELVRLGSIQLGPALAAFSRRPRVAWAPDSSVRTQAKSIMALPRSLERRPGWARWAAEVKASGRSAVKESISLMQGRSRSNKHVPGLPQPEHWEATQAIQSRTGSESPSRGEPQLYEVTVLRIHISFSV